MTIDGPGGVGKTTVIELVTDLITAKSIPVHRTAQPSRTELGNHIRTGTYTYRGMALACLVAGDRHHQLSSEIEPALCAGNIVLCDRYFPSSLVLQRLDGLSPETVWQLNAGVLVPDVAVLLLGDPEVIARRLHAGQQSRFEEQPGSSGAEVEFYHQAAAALADAGWPVLVLDATIEPPETIAQKIARHVVDTYLERSPACLA